VKGLSAERLYRTILSPRDCLPRGRRFVNVLASARFDLARPEWLLEIDFDMLMRDEVLPQLRARFEEASGVLTGVRDGEVLLAADHRAATPRAAR
jgi:hypothetical protein